MTKLEDLIDLKVSIALGGGQARIEKQHEQGKMTARERLETLIDHNNFDEIEAFVVHRCYYFGQEKQHFPGDGVVGGYGKVDGRIVYAYAQDFTVVGGSMGEVQANKICKILENARKVGAPVVGMNASGGARIQEGLDGLEGYGKIFFRNTAASGGVPQITAIMGPCAGGAVYSPALTDFIFQVNKTGKMFITGPDVIKSVTGEQIDAEKLGGAMTHNRVSGVAHFMASDDTDCIYQIRRLLSYLPSNFRDAAPTIFNGDDPNRIADQLDTIIPDNPNKAYDMYDVIKAITDGGAWCVMTGFNRWGATRCGANANLLTGFLRGELGMRGMCITDFSGSSQYMDLVDGLIAGSDIWDSPMPKIHTTKAANYENDAYIVTQMRNAMHHILYTVVNSNAMNGWASTDTLKTITPWWQTAIYALIAVLAVLTILCAWQLSKALKAKKSMVDTAPAADQK